MAAAAAVALISVGAQPVAAGGWAISTLDTVPSPSAGETVEVGFTILQHGRTPVVVEGGVGIEVSGPDGAEFFPAVADTQIGHYTASVTFPDAGSVTWLVRQGGFGDYDLGAIDVRSAVSSPASVSDGPSPWRYPLLLGAISAAALALADFARSRRRPQLT
jgi:hypothetical protein